MSHLTPHYTILLAHINAADVGQRVDKYHSENEIYIFIHSLYLCTTK